MRTRELDLRVWDNVAKRMSYSKIELFDDMLGFRFEHFETDKPIFMLYTGLRDKNGKKIYEGDILRSPMAKELMDNIVIYGHSGFEHKWINEKVSSIRGRDHEPIFRNVSNIFEVIGNVFENPELLER